MLNLKFYNHNHNIDFKHFPTFKLCCNGLQTATDTLLSKQLVSDYFFVNTQNLNQAATATNSKNQTLTTFKVCAGNTLDFNLLLNLEAANTGYEVFLVRTTPSSYANVTSAKITSATRSANLIWR